MSKSPTVKPEPRPGMRSAWTIYRTAIGDFRTHWRIIAGVVGIVAVPVAIMSIYGIININDSATAAYVAFAQLAMNVAIVFALLKLVKGEDVTVKDAYYSGSAAFIRFFLLILVLVLMLMPLVWALFALDIGSAGLALSSGERALLTLAALFFAIPSLLLLSRSIWAIYLVFETPLGPLQAIRASWAQTPKRTWMLAGRIVWLMAFLAVTLIPIFGIVYLLEALLHWRIFAAILQVLLSGLVLPLSHLYLYHHYRDLKR